GPVTLEKYQTQPNNNLDTVNITSNNAPLGTGEIDIASPADPNGNHITPSLNNSLGIPLSGPVQLNNTIDFEDFANLSLSGSFDFNGIVDLSSSGGSYL